MHITFTSVFVALVAMSQLAAAAPVRTKDNSLVLSSKTTSMLMLSKRAEVLTKTTKQQQRNSAREKFKTERCQSQACRDSVDSGCPLSNINFVLGGCDDPSQ